MNFFDKRFNGAVLMRRVCVGACAGVLACSLCFAAGCSTITDATSTDATSSTTTSTVTSIDTSSMDFTYTDRDLDASYDDSAATHITLSNSGTEVDGEGALVDGSVLTITAEGTYVVTGSLSDGQIVVDAGEDAKVQVVLNGVTINCDDNPAIYVKQANKVFITLTDGTTNQLSDGSSYTLVDGSDEPNATLFSAADLTINGTGALAIDANYLHAICSKDDLIITGGTFEIDATQDALRGRDCVKICGGTFDITAGGDGIKSNNDEDATRGFVSIDGGTFDIDAGDDGIQAVTLLRVMDGALTVVSGDDALHSDTDAQVSGGTIDIDAGDDAVHGEFNLLIEGGVITASRCYEGFEGQTITISGGTNTIVSDDDGINAAAGSTESTDESATTNDRATQSTPTTGMQEEGYSTTATLTITGGYTVLDVGGDGLDSNGSLAMSGGTVLVSGPTNDGNGSLDYGSDAVITGGFIMTCGSSGMAQAFGTSSTQASVVASVSGDAGDVVTITDDSGNVIISYEATESFSYVMASSPNLVSGTSYTISVGGTVSGADDLGFCTTGTLSGGTSAGSIEATTEISGTMSTGGMQGGGGMDGAQNMRPTGGAGGM